MNTPQFSSASQLTPTQVAYLQNFAANGLGGRVLLGKLTGVNMNVTTDQAITINSSNYIIRNIVVTNASISLTTAVGGVYLAPSKTIALVNNTQVYSSLAGSSSTIDLTLNVFATSSRGTVNTLYLSLTTPQGAAATADIYIFGDKLD
jgi:hypothetical protein